MTKSHGTSQVGGKRPRIIGLTGKMGSGKDTVGKILGKYEYRRAAFADGVRSEASDAFPELVGEIWKKPTSRRIRILLQWWGTEYRRERNPNYWVEWLEKQLSEEEMYAITDVRFPNEAELVRKLGGEVWKIVGRGGENIGVANHASEAIDEIVPDRVISNSGTIDELAEQIDVLLHKTV